MTNGATNERHCQDVPILLQTMAYRDMQRPNSPAGDDKDEDFRSMFNKLPSPCRPDSPVLPPINYGADRIQNDLLDEICSDIEFKVILVSASRKERF